MRGRPGWILFFGFYILTAAFILIFSSVEVSGIWRAVRLFYPLVLIAFFYEILGYQMFLIHPHSFDSQINNFEMAIVGFDSSFALQPLMTTFLNELMSFSYISYYFLTIVTVSFMIGFRRWYSLERTVLAASLAFYVSYIIFLLYPVMGPRFYLQSIYYLPLHGPFFTPLAQLIVHSGGLKGGAMPSSHCAVALVLIYFLAHEWRRTKIPLLTLFVLICISTVYGRYHYISDVVAGLIIGAVSIIAARIWHNRFITRKNEPIKIPLAKNESAIRVSIED
jgi:membrane-associated phospholipid phosphatase